MYIIHIAKKINGGKLNKQLSVNVRLPNSNKGKATNRQKPKKR